jgi:peptide/nickel transport system substrate-binding protein/oligopeptide transport system substrate-binding protein
MEDNSLTPPDVDLKDSANPRSHTWMVPGTLLVLCLATGAAFFLAAKHRTSIPYAAADQPLAVRGGIFRFPIWERPIQTLDPARATSAGEIMLIQQIYDGLTAFDQHLNIVPALAQYWEISPDGKTYSFELRPDARFHNGEPVTAEDCVFSFERLLTAGLNEANFHYFTRIVGAEDFRAGRTKSVAGLRAIDDRTFQIRFTTPFVPALSVLSMYSSKILPKKEILARGDDFFNAPIGTGPFRFSHWIDEEEDPAIPFFDGVPQGIRLEANTHHFEGRPYLDGVTFRAVWNAPEAKEGKPLNELVDCIETPIEEYDDWVRVETDKLLALNYYILPSNVHPYNDPRVRRAINYALDKRSLLDASPFTSGTPAATGIVPPGIPGFLPMEAPYLHSVEQSKRLLAEAGYPEGEGLPPLEVIVFGRDPLSEARQKCLDSCMSGINLKVKPFKVRRVLSLEDPAIRERPILVYNGWVADFPDPDNFLRVLFHSNSPMNRSGYRNPEVDRLLDLAWSETSYKERNDIYRRIEKMILHDSPIIPLDYDRSRFLVRPNVRGFTLSPLGYPYIEMSKIWLEQPKPENPRTKDL